MRYLTIALTKGRLANKTLELLESVGITCEEMKDKNTRKLIFVNEMCIRDRLYSGLLRYFTGNV